MGEPSLTPLLIIQTLGVLVIFIYVCGSSWQLFKVLVIHCWMCYTVCNEWVFGVILSLKRKMNSFDVLGGLFDPWMCRWTWWVFQQRLCRRSFFLERCPEMTSDAQTWWAQRSAHSAVLQRGVYCVGHFTCRMKPATMETTVPVSPQQTLTFSSYFVMKVGAELEICPVRLFNIHQYTANNV